MTDTEITALAREYAEEKANCISFKAYAEPEFKKELCARGYANDAKEVLEFLLRRFCLVEKSKLSDALMHISNMISNGEELGINRMVAIGNANNALLKSLFPYLGKEVEG